MENLIDQIPGLALTHDSDLVSLEGPITLEAWKEFHNLADKESAVGKPSLLRIGGDMVVDDPIVNTAHVNAYRFLTQNQEIIQFRLLAALKEIYPQLRADFNYDAGTRAALMPDVKHVEAFKKLLALSTVHILNVYKDDFAYVGYQFSCSWDEEHGLGIMTHKDTIIEIGDANTAFLSWIAERDLEPSNLNTETENQTPEEGPEKPGIPEKTWWKFW